MKGFGAGVKASRQQLGAFPAPSVFGTSTELAHSTKLTLTVCAHGTSVGLGNEAASGHGKEHK